MSEQIWSPEVMNWDMYDWYDYFQTPQGKEKALIGAAMWEESGFAVHLILEHDAKHPILEAILGAAQMSNETAFNILIEKATDIPETELKGKFLNKALLEAINNNSISMIKSLRESAGLTIRTEHKEVAKEGKRRNAFTYGTESVGHKEAEATLVALIS